MQVGNLGVKEPPTSPGQVAPAEHLMEQPPSQRGQKGRRASKPDHAQDTSPIDVTWEPNRGLSSFRTCRRRVLMTRNPFLAARCSEKHLEEACPQRVQAWKTYAPATQVTRQHPRTSKLFERDHAYAARLVQIAAAIRIVVRSTVTVKLAGERAARKPKGRTGLRRASCATARTRQWLIGQRRAAT